MASNTGMQFSKALFGLEPGTGYLALATSGQTGNTALSILYLTSVSPSLETETIELQSFENKRVPSIAPIRVSTSFDIEGYYASTGATQNAYSGETNIVGKVSGRDIFRYARQRRTDLILYYNDDGEILKSGGPVVITSFSKSHSTDDATTFSATLDISDGLIEV